MDTIYKVRLVSPKTKERLMKKIYSAGLYERKAAIHGACIKFFTDSREFKDMWEDNFEPMPDWIRPHARLFAVSADRLRVLYEPLSKTVILEGCDYYGWVKSIALALIADFFEDFTSEHRRNSVHGSFIDYGGHGLTIIGPSKSGKTTLTYGLLQDQKFNFVTDDWFFVRFARNGTLIFTSEKNSYIGSDLADNWPCYKEKIKNIRRDTRDRAVMEVRRVLGEDRIRKNSNLKISIILRREKNRPVIEKLGADAAVAYMLRHDFCNPHQLIRSRAKLEKRKSFFRELFKRAPVYLLNTVETPEESLERIKSLIRDNSD